MKTSQGWRLGMKEMQILSAPRQRAQLKKPTWIIVLVSLVSLFLICAYVYPPQGSGACYVFSLNGCKVFPDWLPPAPARELTDEELASHVVTNEILNTPPVVPENPKIAFMFLTPGALPFEKLWDRFFQGHEGKFSVYVHASKDKPVHFSRYFVNREIRSDKVVWGKISMVDAERRLLAYALKETDNQHFVLLSDSCIPLRDFDYVYNYLMYTNISFVDCFEDPGPHGSGRYSEHMLPEVEKKDFRKGAQVPFTQLWLLALIWLNLSLFCFLLRNERREEYGFEHSLSYFINLAVHVRNYSCCSSSKQPACSSNILLLVIICFHKVRVKKIKDQKGENKKGRTDSVMQTLFSFSAAPCRHNMGVGVGSVPDIVDQFWVL